MKIRIVPVVLLLAAALTACGASGGGDGKSKPEKASASPSASATRTMSAVEAKEHCVAAAEAQAFAEEGLSEDEQSGDIPAECDGLPADEQLDAVFEGYQRHNRANIDEARREIEEAASADAQDG